MDRDKFLDESRRGHYRLNESGEPVECKTLREWVNFTDGKDPQRKWNIVRQEQVGPFWISTIFLMLDHNWSRGGPPVLWETMIFCESPNHKWHQDTERCGGGREQAEAMHASVVAKCRALVKVKVKTAARKTK